MQLEAPLDACSMQSNICAPSAPLGDQGETREGTAARFEPGNQARKKDNPIAIVYPNKCHPRCCRNPLADLVLRMQMSTWAASGLGAQPRIPLALNQVSSNKRERAMEGADLRARVPDN